MPRPRRSVSLRAALLSVLAVGLLSGGVGGLVGGLVAEDRMTGAAGNLSNDIPSDTPSRPPDTIAGVAQRVSPSVVSIRGSGPQDSGNGSGFVIQDNYVVTNNHVSAALEGGGIEVVYSDGHSSPATVVGAAPGSDLAVLELSDPLDVDPLEFGDSDDVTVGDTVIAIGAPLGLDGTVTTGIISAVDRPVTVGETGAETYLNALQTDAAINPGNSGGPLVDAQGRVIGVNSAIATMGGGMTGEQSGSIGLGFAIPAAQAQRVVDQLIRTGEAPYAVIGAVLDMRYQESGALISTDKAAGGTAVVGGGPADRAGLRSGDVIVEFDGESVRDANQLVSMIRDRTPGDEVEITYRRDGEERTTEMTLGSSNE
ncbi:S1C family serine protease [Marinactinospora rubrisoli]|uniref:S1C family serine protease n=1 Tax=Marinactinospora rubrisoli TaxID=2715399 RepID=A0ABW2KC64_9ACTN